MTRRSKIRSKYRINKSDLKFFRELRELREASENVEIIKKSLPSEIYLSSTDRITHVGLKSIEGKIVKVINVSYEINISDKWITIVRFDSHHSYLHRHTRISMDNKEEIEDSVGVKKKGDPTLWYTWAIQHIRNRFIEYRTKFTKRSSIQNLGY